MPIARELTENDHDILLHHWKVEDMDRLAGYVAQLLLGRWLHIEKILIGEDVSLPEHGAAVIEKAIASLEPGASSTDEKTTRRDGWLFQMVSWIVAHQEHSGLLVKAPHEQSAAKGLDGLVIKVEDGMVAWVLVCEDKATDNPRDKVQSQVWTEFEAHERGEKDDHLTSAAQTLLHSRVADPLAATAATDWYGERRYRVSVAGPEPSPLQRVHPFDGFRNCVPGENHRRHGNMWLHTDLRAAMQDLADAVQHKLEALRS